MPSLPTRQLGRGGPQVTALGLGLMGLSAFYGVQRPENERMAFLDYAYSIGQHHWDSADVYGDSEDLIGRWLQKNPEKRKDIFLVTKFANIMQPDMTNVINSSPEYCEQACHKSLQRLGVETIDLYYCHRLNKNTPIEKTVEAMAKLKKEGKIRYLGLSECSSESLRRAHKVHPISAVQIEYSPFTLDIESSETDLLKTCRELGVAVVAYSPLGRGMLSGTLKSPDDLAEDDYRKRSPRFSKENFPKNLELVKVITDIANKKGVTPTQLTLAWLLAQGPDIIPIPGTTKEARLKENVEALDIILSSEEEKEIRKACENAEVSGPRYPHTTNSALFADTVPLN